MKKILLAALLFLLTAGLSQAADTAPAKQDPAWLTEARASIKAEKYNQAIQQLQTANETSSADWNNLLGYSLRKKQPPDLVGAEKYYQAALKLQAVIAGRRVGLGDIDAGKLICRLVLPFGTTVLPHCFGERDERDHPSIGERYSGRRVGAG